MYGAVHLLTHKTTGAPFVAKIMKLEAQNDTWAEERRVKRVLKSARNEATVLGELDHPNISRLVDIYTDEDHFVMVQEWCAGGDLFHQIISRDFFSERDAARVIKELLVAVDYLHSRNICHRDIKAENIICQSNQVKLIDFGLACKYDPEKGMNGYAGTRTYMSPEML